MTQVSQLKPCGSSLEMCVHIVQDANLNEIFVLYL
jgi:hypothetical protein